MADNPRIEELRRRVQQDPASIAFAALAEEYRRAGQFESAIDTCRAGLQRHPAYLSARVTLGRALLELGQYDEARSELEQVLKAAPENLAANRALAEIQARTSDGGHSVTPIAPVTAAAAQPPSLPTPTPPKTVPPTALRPPTSPISVTPFEVPPTPPAPMREDARVERLERFLAAIQRAKAAPAARS
jgi:tetratricopeptide (TPR) repeat protein